MPFRRDRRFEIIDRRKRYGIKILSTIYDLRSNISNLRGFSLVELLVVMTIFVLTSTLVLSGYLTFERNQRLKNAAFTLKSNIRLAQNNALTGDKADSTALCGATTKLVGWYVRFRTSSSSSYTINGLCITGSSENIFGTKTYTLPKGVTLTRINFGLDISEANVLFRPLSEIVSFHNSTVSGSPPDFLDSSEALRVGGLLSGGTELIIELIGQNVPGKYQIIIKQPTGEVYEKFVP